MKWVEGIEQGIVWCVLVRRGSEEKRVRVTRNERLIRKIGERMFSWKREQKKIGSLVMNGSVLVYDVESRKVIVMQQQLVKEWGIEKEKEKEEVGISEEELASVGDIESMF